MGFFGFVLRGRGLSANGSLKTDYGPRGRHTRATQDALGATVGETAGANDVASGLLAGENIGDGEGVEYVHGVGFVGVGLG